MTDVTTHVLQAEVLFQPFDEAVEVNVVGAELSPLSVLFDGDCVALPTFLYGDWFPVMLVDERAQLSQRRVISPPGHVSAGVRRRFCAATPARRAAAAVW